MVIHKNQINLMINPDKFYYIRNEYHKERHYDGTLTF